MTTCYQPLGAVEIRTAEMADLPVIADLARLIWRHHYPSIISPEQIEYMLAWRYSPEAMTRDVTSGQLTFELLSVDGEPVAFAGHGPGDAPEELKLRQLYVHPEWQGRGLGGRLIRRVESAARATGRSSVVLTVNRRNDGAIAAYQRSGFAVRESANFDIGQGFVMEDYVMVKRLAETVG